MIKIFFITFFIAELIIALTVIIKIWQLDKLVNACNEMIVANKSKIVPCFADFRLLINEFNTWFAELLKFIQQKREEYSLKFLKTSLIYGSIFLLKGKYKKSVFAFQVAREIYEGIKEADV